MRADIPSLLVAVPLVATWVVYRSLPSVYFFSDDFLHLFSIVDADLCEFLLRPHGAHLLLTRNAVFAAFYQLFGMDAAPYFWVVLLTHLFNTALVFRIVVNWIGSAPVAALSALLWGTCPLHAATLTWYSVYGQVLVATILLIILLQASRYDRTTAQPPSSIMIVWPLLFIVASTCFGTGIGLLLVSPVAMFWLLPRSRQRVGVCLALLGIALVTPTAYRHLIIYHDRLVGNWEHLYGMSMALATLPVQLSNISLMIASLLSSGASDLVLSFADAAVRFPSTVSRVVTALYGSALLATFILASARVRYRLLGLLLLTVGCYGIIAAGRAMLTPLTMAGRTIPRYHYVATIPLAILLGLCVARLTALSRHATALQYGLLLITLLAVGVLYSRAPSIIDLHSEARAETRRVVDTIRTTIANAPPGGDVRIANRRFVSVGVMLADFRSGFPGWAGIFVLFFPSNTVDGRRVRFVVNDPQLVKASAVGKRTRGLIVVGDEAPPSPVPPPLPQTRPFF